MRTQVIVESTAPQRWQHPHGLRAVVSIAFVIIHVAGAVYAFRTLEAARIWTPVLRILVDFTVNGLAAMGLPDWITRLGWALFPLCIGIFVLVMALGAAEAGRSLRRLWRGQPEPDAAVRLRALVYIAMACLLVNLAILSSSETFAGPFRLRFPILGAISATFAYGSYALWSILHPRFRHRVPLSVRRGLDVIGMNAVLIVLLAEVALRITATFWPSPLLVTDRASSRVRREADRRAAGTLLFNFPVNAGGHYDSDFVARSASTGPIAVSIGDSFSYGTVPHAFHFTTVAERENPGIEFYNMGYSNLGPSDYVELLKLEAIPLQPDLVVIQLFIGNDVTDGRGLATVARRWHDADSYMVAVVWHRLRILARAEAAKGASTIDGTYMSLEQLADAYPWLADPALERPSFSKTMHLEIESRNARGVTLGDDGLYERFFEQLSELERSAQSGNTRLAFVLIPAEFQVEDDLWKEIAQTSDRPLDRDRPQRLIRKWLRGRSPVLDLLPIFRAVPPMQDGRRHLYHLQDTHFNARGNAVAGRALAHFAESILSNSYVEPPAPAEYAMASTSRPSQVSLPLHLDFGQSSARQWMLSGWYADETAGGETYAWSEGKQSVLALPLPKADIRMAFQVLPFLFRGNPTQRIAVVANGRKILEVALRPELHRYSVVLPADALGEELDVLEFHYAYTRSPRHVVAGSADVRTLSVAWYAVEFSLLTR